MTIEQADERLEHTLAAMLIGAEVPTASQACAVVDRALAAGVAPLLAQAPAARVFPDDQRARLAAATRDTAAAVAVLDRTLTRAYRALTDRGVDVVAFKGAHLAHAVYRAPHLRPRRDIDLLIRPGDRDRAAAALADAGFTPALHVRGSVLLGQFHFERQDPAGTAALDVHWRPFAPLVLAQIRSSEDVLGEATTITVDGARIAVPSLVDALSLAVLHHTAHHQRRWEVLWLHDVLLIVRALTPRERGRFIARTRNRAFTRIAAAVLQATADLFGDADVAALAADAARSSRGAERTSALLHAGRTRWTDLWLDLRAASWRDRWTLVREHALPPADYMRGSGDVGWLPLAYARRALLGALRWR